MKASLQKKLGQNTAEYLIMLTLIAVGSIGLVTAFGQQIRNRIAMVTSAFNGDDAKYGEAQTRSGKNADRNSTLSAGAFGIKGSTAENKEFSDAAQQ
jgi:Flp pilus assembly pilin Flp